MLSSTTIWRIRKTCKWRSNGDLSHFIIIIFHWIVFDYSMFCIEYGYLLFLRHHGYHFNHILWNACIVPFSYFRNSHSKLNGWNDRKRVDMQRTNIFIILGYKLVIHRVFSPIKSMHRVLFTEDFVNKFFYPQTAS